MEGAGEQVIVAISHGAASGSLCSSFYPISQGSPREPGQVGAGAQTPGKGWGWHPADFLALCQARAACCVQEIFNILCLKERAWKGSKTVLNTSAGSYTDGNGEGGGKVAVCKNNPCRASRAHSIQRAQVVVSEHKSPFLPPVAHTQCKAHL